jgi:predicted transcriptional regulator
MSEEKTRVEFDAPKSLVERVDTVAAVLDIPRTRLLIDAPENKLDELANEECTPRFYVIPRDPEADLDLTILQSVCD